jgi:hypothetical protein
MDDLVDELADTLVLGALLARVRERWGRYELVDHFQQGEFHHDVVLAVPAARGLPGGVLVVATNCNGGVKEVLWLRERPTQAGLWRTRCPDNPEFDGATLKPLSTARTVHWFDPCELLVENARSELREEYRARQCGGGWIPKRG